MDIRMAIQAAAGHARETLHNRSVLPFLEMTLFTPDIGMLPGQLECRGVVIKFHLAPGFNIMTVFAIFLSEKLRINIILVDVFVTIHACFFQILKDPVCPPFMTGKARRGEM